MPIRGYAHLFLVAGAFIAVCLLVRLVLVLLERRRRRVLERAAEELGLRFSPGGAAAPAEAMQRLPLFWYGVQQRARNVLSGRIEDLRAWLFDYQYRVPYGTIEPDNTEASLVPIQTVAVIRLAEDRLPDFEARPREAFARRAPRRRGYHRVRLPEFPAFDERYLVRGRDEAAVRAALTDELLAYLLHRDGLCLDAGGPWLVVYRPQRRLAPSQMAELLEEAFEIGTILA
ncbi:MAG: hypothetical protein SYC29_11725 [Planctomycetota bacterium]|nr:hypothetical protein [Planctomycetota bacterium]